MPKTLCFFGGLIFRRAYFQKGSLLEGFLFQNGLGLLRLQLKTANPNSPLAYDQEGLLLGFLEMRFEELICGRAHFLGG